MGRFRADVQTRRYMGGGSRKLELGFGLGGQSYSHFLAPAVVFTMQY